MEKNKIKTSTGEKIFTVFNYAFFTLLCLIMLVTAFQKFVQKKLEDAENKPVKLTVTTEQNTAARASSATPAHK